MAGFSLVVSIKIFVGVLSSSYNTSHLNLRTHQYDFFILESVARSVWYQTGRFVVVFLYRRNVRMILVYVIYEQGSDMTIFVFHTMVHLIQYC